MKERPKIFGTPFKAGVSGNPKGRPKSKHALSEAIRAGIDPSEMVDRALGILRNPKTPDSVKLQTWMALADRGWARPPAERELTVDVRSTPTLPADWASLSPGERLAYLEQLRVGALPLIDLDCEDPVDPDAYETREQESQLTEIAPDQTDMERDTGAVTDNDD